MNKEIVFNQEAKEKLKSGIEKLKKAVVITLGPSGRNVIIEKEYGQITSTKDGVTVAKSINFSDPIENIGAQLVKQASIKTAEQAGDGTTTSTLLACELIYFGLYTIKAGSNAVGIKRGMDKACKLVVQELKNMSKRIVDENQLKQVATISANSDEEIGNLVSTAMEKVGRDGIVTVEESRTGETNLEIVEGLQFDRGYKSPYFVTNNNTMQSLLNDPFILIYDKSIMQIQPLLPILESVASQGKSLLIIAEDIDNEALATLIVNKSRGTIKVCAVKAPEFGEKRTHVLEDIAILTGGTVVSSIKGMKLEKFDTSWFGQARLVTIGRDTTTIIDGKGDTDKIGKRMLELKSQIDNSTSSYEIEKLQERLSKMAGGVAIINVGGSNEIEIKEKRDRVDDALQATKAALEEGILPGGGIALMRASRVLEKSKLSGDDELGAKLINYIIHKPFTQILLNAGYDENKIHEIMYGIKSKNNVWLGFNPKTNEKVDMFEEGIIDPTKVVRCALENAVAVAGTFLITECVISNEKQKENKPEINQEVNY